METTAFFEQKLGIHPRDMNKVRDKNIETILQEQISKKLEGKCSEHGFVLPGTVKIISRSMGYYDQSNFTGDTNYFVKAEARVINSIDEMNIIVQVIRKNKMGLYANYKDSIRILVPRDLHIGNQEFENVQIGDNIQVKLKKSKFQVNDPYILASAVFIRRFQEGDEIRLLSGVEESKTYD